MEILLDLATTNTAACLLIFHSKSGFLTMPRLPAAEHIGRYFFLGLKKEGRRNEWDFLDIVWLFFFFFLEIDQLSLISILHIYTSHIKRSNSAHKEKWQKIF